MYVQTYDMILLITCNRHFVGIEGQKHHWRQGKKGGEARVRSSPKLSFSLLLFIYIIFVHQAQSLWTNDTTSEKTRKRNITLFYKKKCFFCLQLLSSDYLKNLISSENTPELTNFNQNTSSPIKIWKWGKNKETSLLNKKKYFKLDYQILNNSNKVADWIM